jgi:prepilin-type N-terminal cleavage/methylation domain-containing protein
MKSSRRWAFTLIELLIVVAIIAILAAIAVPNFLEAQTRAKVSRVKADMRSIATAVESYVVDWNQIPPPWDINGNGANYVWGTTNEPPFHSRAGSVLTTPIAYITTIPIDVFLDKTTYLNPATWGGAGPANELSHRIPFWNYPYFRATPLTSDGFMRGNRAVGEWLLYSAGPDRDVSNGGGSFYTPYDATNGTVSLGNVFRTQRTPDGIDYANFLAPW